MKRRIQLTQGNVDNGHFYIDSLSDWIPKEAYGGPSKSDGLGATITLELVGVGTIETDIGTDRETGEPRRFFRARRPVQDFYDWHDLKAGDSIQVEHVGERQLKVSPLKGQA